MGLVVFVGGAQAGERYGHLIIREKKPEDVRKRSIENRARKKP